MFARVSTISGSPDRFDEMQTQVRDNVLPKAKEIPGFKGVLSMADRSSGKTVTVTFWETEQTMEDSEEAANKLREDTASELGEQILSVERFEVVLDER